MSARAMPAESLRAPLIAEVREDERLLRVDTTSDNVLNVVLAHLVVVVQQVQGLLELVLLRQLRLLLHISLQQVLLVV